MKEELLGEICDFSYGEGLREDRRKPGKVPVYGSNGIVGWHNQAVSKGPTIVIGRKGSIGEVHFSPIPCWPIDTTYYVEAPKKECDLRWLYRALVALDLTKLNKAAAVPGLNREDAYRKRILFPDVSKQKRIAALLEKADTLRRTRRYARQLSDTFLQSVFLEMFGDLPLNPMGWDMGYLGDVIHSAQDGPHVSPRYRNDGIAFLSTRHIRPGEITWNDLKYISKEDAKDHWRKVKPEKGDILYTKGGTTGLAKAIDFDREIAVWVHIAVLKLRKDKVLPVWLENMLNSLFCYRQSQQLTFGIVNRDLGLKRMPRIRIYIPPLPLQQKFADIVRRFERLRAQQREAERQAEHLFQTLLHRAFNSGI